MGEAIIPAGITGEILIPIVELCHIGGESIEAQTTRHLARIPKNGITLPSHGVDGLTVSLGGLDPFMPRPGRIMRTLQDAGIEAHDGERHLEGRGRAETFIAYAVAMYDHAGTCIEDHRAGPGFLGDSRGEILTKAYRGKKQEKKKKGESNAGNHSAVVSIDWLPLSAWQFIGSRIQ